MQDGKMGQAKATLVSAEPPGFGDAALAVRSAAAYPRDVLDTVLSFLDPRGYDDGAIHSLAEVVQYLSERFTVVWDIPYSCVSYYVVFVGPPEAIATACGVMALPLRDWRVTHTYSTLVVSPRT